MGRGDVARLADFTLGLGAALRPDRTARPPDCGDPILTRIGPVEVCAREGRLSFHLDSGEAWRLAASAFAGEARLAVEQGGRIVTFALRGGGFPGTTLSADLDGRLEAQGEGARLSLSLAFAGVSADVDAAAWLEGKAALAGAASFQRAQLSEAVALRLGGPGRLALGADWRLRLDALEGAAPSP